jgi:hypothetical protein
MLTYEKSYTSEVAKKWEAKGGKEAYIKAAKAWNTKKYGTTEPTATAKKQGMTKPDLATRQMAGKNYGQPGGPVSSDNVPNLVSAPKDTTLTSSAISGSGFTKINATDTKSNASMQGTITKATQTRKEKRFERRTDAGRRTKEITTDSAGNTTKTISKGGKTKKTVTRDSGGNKTTRKYKS